MATAPKNNSLAYDPESTRLSVSNNMKKALKNSYNAALKQYVDARSKALKNKAEGKIANAYNTAEVRAASKLVKNALNVMEMRGVPLNHTMKQQKKIHNKLFTSNNVAVGGKRKTRKASRRRLTRRRR
jgi:hypothetical protein